MRKGGKDKPAGRVAKATSAKTAAADGGSRDDRGKRLLDLVVLLLGARLPVPYREIKAQFKAYRTAQEEAGLRAFERDKADLLDLGVPIRYVTPEEDDGIEEAGYIVDLRRYRLPEIHLTAEEIAALMLAGSIARAAPGTTYDEVVDLALKKLAFDLPAAPDSPGAPGAAFSGKKPEPVLVHFPRPSEAAALSERLAIIEHAIANRKKVTFDYVSFNGERSTRPVWPYGLVYHDGTWHLVAYDEAKYRRVVTFRCDRIDGAVVEAPKPKTPDFDRPAEVDVRRFASRSPWLFEKEPPFEAVLDMRHDAAAVANEDFGDKATREPLEGGGVRVTFPCSNGEFVISRVLEAKGAIVIRAPQTLRKRFLDELDALERKYS